jgi:hypothetical protein
MVFMEMLDAESAARERSGFAVGWELVKKPERFARLKKFSKLPEIMDINPETAVHPREKYQN